MGRKIHIFSFFFFKYFIFNTFLKQKDAYSITNFTTIDNKINLVNNSIKNNLNNYLFYYIYLRLKLEIHGVVS
jgi:hypothetical protein